jgi:hypothetical protein
MIFRQYLIKTFCRCTFPTKSDSVAVWSLLNFSDISLKCIENFSVFNANLDDTSVSTVSRSCHPKCHFSQSESCWCNPIFQIQNHLSSNSFMSLNNDFDSYFERIPMILRRHSNGFAISSFMHILDLTLRIFRESWLSSCFCFSLIMSLFPFLWTSRYVHFLVCVCQSSTSSFDNSFTSWMFHHGFMRTLNDVVFVYLNIQMNSL